MTVKIEMMTPAAISIRFCGATENVGDGVAAGLFVGVVVALGSMVGVGVALGLFVGVGVAFVFVIVVGVVVGVGADVDVGEYYFLNS